MARVGASKISESDSGRQSRSRCPCTAPRVASDGSVVSIVHQPLDHFPGHDHSLRQPDRKSTSVTSMSTPNATVARRVPRSGTSRTPTGELLVRMRG
jgi:hypothetical protein